VPSTKFWKVGTFLPYHHYHRQRPIRQTATRKGFLQTSHLCLAVPRSMLKEILLEALNSLIGSHRGKFKTSHRLYNELWWPSMADNIAKHVSGCVKCQASTTGNHSDTAPLVPLPAICGCGKQVHCDIFGPVATSRQKNNYILVIMLLQTRHSHGYSRKGGYRRRTSSFIALLHLWQA
jgi:hypothetical protein